LLEHGGGREALVHGQMHILVEEYEAEAVEVCNAWLEEHLPPVLRLCGWVRWPTSESRETCHPVLRRVLESNPLDRMHAFDESRRLVSNGVALDFEAGRDWEQLREILLTGAVVNGVALKGEWDVDWPQVCAALGPLKPSTWAGQLADRLCLWGLLAADEAAESM